MQSPNQEKSSPRRPSLMPASDTPITDEVRMLDSISKGLMETGDLVGGSKPKRRRTTVVLVLLTLVAIVVVAVIAAMAAGMKLPINWFDGSPLKAMATAEPERARTGSAATHVASVRKPADDVDHPLPEGEGARDSGPLAKALEEGLAPPPTVSTKASDAKR